MSKIDLEFLKQTLLEIDPTLKGAEQDDSFCTALVLLAALRCGPDIRRLAEITKCDLTFVANIHRRMIRAELWTELDVFCDHWFRGTEFRSVAFWTDVLVAQGLVIRRWSKIAAISSTT